MPQRFNGPENHGVAGVLVFISIFHRDQVRSRILRRGVSVVSPATATKQPQHMLLKCLLNHKTDPKAFLKDLL